MKKKSNWLFNKAGFIGIETLIVMMIMAGFGGVAINAVEKAMGRPFVELFPQNLKNPFPSRPAAKDPSLPVEIIRNPYIDNGKPIINSYTATGEWHGDYKVTYPPACYGISGKWSANLVDNNGDITGNFTSDFGESGTVTGRSVGGAANWKVESGQGLKFDGGITGNTITGNFSNGSPCGYSSGEEPAEGNFFGGRIVK